MIKRAREERGDGRRGEGERGQERRVRVLVLCTLPPALFLCPAAKHEQRTETQTQAELHQIGARPKVTYHHNINEKKREKLKKKEIAEK